MLHPFTESAGNPQKLYLRHAGEFLAALVFAAVFVLVRGYVFGVGNHVTFLPVIEALLGETALSEDFYVSRLIHYHTNFIYACVILSKWLGMPATFFLGYVMTSLLFFSASALYRVPCLRTGAYSI